VNTSMTDFATGLTQAEQTDKADWLGSDESTETVFGSDPPKPDLTQSKSLTDTLVELVCDHGELFHDCDGVGYVQFQRDDHRETWRLESRGFREWSSHLLYRQHRRSIGSQGLNDAIRALSGIARYDHPERPVWVRTACLDGVYYIDLCDAKWRCIEIKPTGWRILNESPVHFIRREAMRALPEPGHGGQLSMLWPLINIPKSKQKLLLVWIIECFRPDTPFPLLELSGEQGSAKSTTQGFLRRLIDPNKVDLRAAPKDRESVFVAARNGWVVSFENLSCLSAELQDAFCTIATGGGWATRRLYSNEEESIIEVMQPVMLNGISPIVTAQDLLDRTLHFELEPIVERRTQQELETMFEQQAESIFGALLDLYARALREIPQVHIPDPPRMADFAVLGAAVYRALSSSEAQFISDYADARQQAVVRTLESSSVATAIRQFIAKHPAGVTDTAGRLLGRVGRYKVEGDSSWPRSPIKFSAEMRRAVPALRQMGIEVKPDGHTEAGNRWTIRRINPSAERIDTDTMQE
jgi:hypothetical protein